MLVDLAKLSFMSSILAFAYYYVMKVQNAFYLAILLVILSIAILFYLMFSEVKKFSRVEISQIDKMTGTEFEKYTKFLLDKNGFQNTKVTKAIGDQGIDVIAKRNGTKFGFQCKRWKKNVGNKAIQEAHAGIGYYSLDKAIVITNSHFTKSAKELANKLSVELWDREALIKLLEQTKRNELEKEKAKQNKKTIAK